MHMKRRLSLIVTFLVITLVLCNTNVSVYAEKNKYVYNKSYHGAFLYDRNQCIIGILMNGVQLSPKMLNTGLRSIDNKISIKLPGIAAYAWIDKANLVDEEPAVTDLVIGITNRIMDSGYLYTSPTMFSENTDKRLEDGEHVIIGGRYLDSYYLPEKDPCWISAKELKMKVNDQRAKFRLYNEDLLSYSELEAFPGEPDGTECFSEETALVRIQEILKYEYKIEGLEQMPSTCQLSISHMYSSVGKTWLFTFGDYKDEKYYEGELVDISGELYMLQCGEYGDKYLIYKGFPCQ